MSQLALNGELIQLKNCKISLQQNLADNDQSGQTSATLTAEQGDKSKELMVSGLIPFSDAQKLSRLFELATAKDGVGNRVIYRVGCELASAVKIRQAKFFGQVSAPEHQSLLAWNVSFSLREYLSVPEVAEIRRELPEASAQTTDNTVAVAAVENIQNDAPAVTVSFGERVLTNIDNWLGGNTGAAS